MYTLLIGAQSSQFNKLNYLVMENFHSANIFSLIIKWKIFMKFHQSMLFKFMEIVEIIKKAGKKEIEMINTTAISIQIANISLGALRVDS